MDLQFKQSVTVSKHRMNLRHVATRSQTKIGCKMISVV